MLSITKTRSPQYPEDEYRLQLKSLAGLKGDAGTFQFMGSSPTATWFSTSQNPQRDFGIATEAEFDFENEFRPIYAGLLPDGRKLRGLVSVRGGKGSAKRSIPVQAFDLTFSAPKCMSLLIAAAMVREDLESIDSLRRIHDAAVKKSLIRFRDQFVSSRSGRGGAIKHKGGEILAAAFTHFEARPQDDYGMECAVGDPQLHTHVYLMNTVKCSDGIYRALDASKFIRRAKQAGLWFRSYLAKLMRSAGLPVRTHSKADKRDSGYLEIESITPIEMEFSRRSQRINRYMGQEGWSAGDTKLRRRAALYTRQAKSRSAEGPVNSWRVRLKRWMKVLPPIHVVSEDQLSQFSKDEAEKEGPRVLEQLEITYPDKVDKDVEAKALVLSIGRSDPDDFYCSVRRLHESSRLNSTARGPDRADAEVSGGFDTVSILPAPKFLQNITRRNLRTPFKKAAPPANHSGHTSHDHRLALLPARLRKWEQMDLVDAYLAVSELPDLSDKERVLLEFALKEAIQSKLGTSADEVRAAVIDGLGGSKGALSSADIPRELRQRIRHGISCLEAGGLIESKVGRQVMPVIDDIDDAKPIRRP